MYFKVLPIAIYLTLITWLFEGLKPVRICLDIWQQLMSATATSSQFELLLNSAIKSIMFLGKESVPQKHMRHHATSNIGLFAMVYSNDSLLLHDLQDGAGELN